MWKHGVPWDPEKGFAWAYVGGGPSIQFGRASAGGEAEGFLAATGFLHAGVWWFPKDSDWWVLGVEARYSLGGTIEVGGEDRSLAGPQLFLVVLAFR